MTDYSNWGIRKFARHYVETISGTQVSAVFGDSKNILLVATVKFGKGAVDKAFSKEITKAEARKGVV